MRAGATDNPLLLQLVNSRTRTGDRRTTSKMNNLVSGTTSRAKNLVSELNLDKVSDLPGQKSNWSCLRSCPDLSRGVGPSGSEVKLKLKKWPVLLRIGLLKYPGGLVISPYFTILFFSNSPPLIFFNFNKFHFLSV